MFIHSLSIHNPQVVWIKFRLENPAAAAQLKLSPAFLERLRVLRAAP